MKRYPFKFLNAYDAGDKDIFFGRTEEIEALYKMVFLTNILLVYGASGTGKTSLIQCGLANKFQDYDWLALYIRRGKNIISSIDKTLCNNTNGIFNYKETPDIAINDLNAKFEAVYLASFRPIYLIFDQFEELYVLGTAQEQAQFIETIKQILQIEQPIKIIISIREEYLGYLYEFEKAIPQLLHKKLRVEPMNLEKVKTVITGIGNLAESIVSLEKGKESLIAETIFNKVRGKDKSLYIQLPYLQVFLDKFYLQITQDEQRQQEATFTQMSLEKMGDLGDVLRQFLEEQVSKIAKNLLPNEEKAEEIIWKILSPFVTLEGTKEPISEQKIILRLKDTDSSLIKKAIEAFKNSRILRYNEDDDAYETTHDALAKQIHAKRSAEELEILRIQRIMNSFLYENAEDRAFFSEKLLANIDANFFRLILEPAEIAWVEKSKAHWIEIKTTEEKRKIAELEKEKAEALEKNKKLLQKVINVVFIILLFGGGSFILYRYLSTYSNYLQNASQLAQSNSTTAFLNAEKAYHQVGFSKDKSEEALITSLYSGIFYQDFGKDNLYTSLLYSADGKYLISGDENGNLVAWNEVGKQVFRKKEHKAMITTIRYNDDKTLLLTTSAEGTYILWDKNFNIVKKGSLEYSIRTTIFSPKENELWLLSDKYMGILSLDWKKDSLSLFPTSDFNVNIGFANDSLYLQTYTNRIEVYPLTNKQIQWSRSSTISEVRNIEFTECGLIFLNSSLEYGKIYNYKEKQSQTLSQYIPTGSTKTSADCQFTAQTEIDNFGIIIRKNGQKIHSLKGHTSTILDMAFSPDGKRLASISMDRTLKVWNLAAYINIDTKKEMFYRVFPLLEGDFLVQIKDTAGNHFLKIKNSQTQTNKTVCALKSFRDNVAVSAEAKQIVVGTKDTLLLYDFEGKKKATLKIDSRIYKVFFQGQKIYTLNESSEVSCLEASSLKVTNSVIKDTTISNILYSPVNQHFWGVVNDTILTEWDASGEKLFQKIFKYRILRMEISPDGKTIFFSDAIRAIYKLDVEKQQYSLFAQMTESVASMCISPDNQRIAAVCWDGKVYIWTTQGKNILSYPIDFSDKDKTMYFSEDSNYLYCISKSDGILRFPLTAEAILKFVREEKAFGDLPK